MTSAERSSSATMIGTKPRLRRQGVNTSRLIRGTASLMRRRSGRALDSENSSHGNEGYLGGVIVPALRAHGYDVMGLDTGFFADQLFTPSPAPPTVRTDIRNVSADVFEGVDAVIHLAALSNDPLGNLDAGLTCEINVEGTLRVAQLAKIVGVRRFVFASSCVIYGATGGLADETTPLAPGTAYARSKVAGELALAELANDGSARSISATAPCMEPHHGCDWTPFSTTFWRPR